MSFSKVKIFTFNPFQENTYIVWNENKDCLVIDPGCYERHEKEELRSFIESEGLNPIYLINTHGHIDHVLGNQFIKSTYNIPFLNHELDVETLRSVEQYSQAYGFKGYENSPMPDRHLAHGEQLELEELKFEIRFTPGHAPGHIILINHADKYIIGGDVIFKQSVGRTDLPGGSFEELEKSIREQLYTLPDNYTVFPGHGPSTEIGYEKMNNGFVNEIVA